MSKKRKKYNHQSSLEKSLNRTINGFWMRWKIEDPLGDHDKPIAVQVGSKNPVIGIRLRDDGFWGLTRQVLHRRVLKWRMTIEIDFEKADGSTEVKSRVLVGVGALPDLDDSYQSTVENMLADAVEKNYIGKYQLTRVHQEVLSGFLINKEDFEEDAA